MELNIKLSIEKRKDYARNTFILRWNPAISSYTMARLDSDMEDWAKGYWNEDDFDWSIYEWQKAHRGDRFIMVRVGDGNTGIMAAGRFTSEPYKGEESTMGQPKSKLEPCGLDWCPYMDDNGNKYCTSFAG